MDFHEQAKAIWSTLDKLALEDPEGYKKFIQEQLSSVNEVFKATTSPAGSTSNTSSSKGTTQGQNLGFKLGQNGQLGLMGDLASLLTSQTQTQNQNQPSNSSSNEKKESKSKTIPNLMRNETKVIKVVTKVDHEVPSGSIKKKEKKGSISGDGHDNDDDGGTKKLTDDVFGHSTSLLLNPFIIQELEEDEIEPEVLIKELRLPGQMDKKVDEPADDGSLKTKKPLIEEL